MPPLVTRRRFTVNDYHRMGKAGILHAEDRVELLNGEIVQMAAVGDRHFATVNRSNAIFTARTAGRAIVSVQGPIRLDRYSEPEPDLVLLQLRDDFYESGKPGPASVLLLIEVSDTTLGYDRRKKLPSYATVGIAEFWIVNLPKDVIEVYREPREGRYQQVTIYGRGEEITLLLLPDITVAVNELLPSPPR